MDDEIASPEVFTKQTQKLIGGIQEKPLKEREPEYQKAMAKTLSSQIQAGVDVEREKIARDVDVKQSGAREGERLSEVQRMEQKGFAEKLDKYAPPTFQPSQEDLTTYAQLGSSIVTLGMMLGGGGKVPAKAALASMTGMLNGWRTGRKDLYERESKNFEKESQRLTAVRKSIQDDMNQAMSLWPTKRKDAMALIESARYKAGSESVLGAMLYKGNYDGAMKLLESARKTDEAKLKNENDIAARKAIEAAKDRRHREDMIQKAAAAKTKAESKPVARSAINERYANTVYRSGNEVLRSLQLIEQIGITTGGGVLGAVVGKGTIPSELQRQLGQVFTEEQQRNYNTAMSGVALEMAYVLNGGYKPDAGTINKLENLLSVGPQDTAGSAAYKFSDVVAKLKAAVEVTPMYTPAQEKINAMLMEKLDKYATPEMVFERYYGVAGKEEPAVRKGAEKLSKPTTEAEFKALPPGSQYIDPDDGKTYRKPK